MLSKDFSSSSLNNVCDSLFYMSGNEFGTTVGVGSENDGTTKLIIKTLDPIQGRTMNLLFNPNSKGNISLVNIVYMIDYYSHLHQDVHAEGDSFCFDPYLVPIKCKTVTSLSVAQRSWTDVVNIAIKWDTSHLEIDRIQITLRILNDPNVATYIVAGNSRAMTILNLKPKTRYILNLTTFNRNGSVHNKSLRFRTKKAL